MRFVPKQLERLESSFSIPKATFIIAALTLVSRLSGLVRTRLFTSHFGADTTLDIYYASFRIPDFIMNVLVLGTLTVALLPVFTKYLVKDKEKAHALASNVLTIALVVMAIVCAIVAIFLEPLLRHFLPGFSVQSLASTVLLTRLILLAQVIFAVSSLYTTILNAQKRFLVAALAPVLYNVGIIFGLLVLYPRFNIAGLGYGVLLGSALHFLLQAVEAIRLGFIWKPKINLRFPALREVLRLFVPRLFFIDLSQISLIIASFLGSFLLAGSISVFNLAFDLQAVPTGVFALSTAIAAFPVLAESFAADRKKQFWDILAKSTMQILFFIIPISIGMLVFRAHIVRLLFGTGHFNWEDTIATFQVLGVFTFSLFSQSLVPLFSRALYARHNTKTPMIIGILCVLVNVVASYVLASARINGEVLGVLGVAYGFTISSILNVIILYVILRATLAKESKSEPEVLHAFDTKVSIGFIKIIIASVTLGVVSFVFLRVMDYIVNTHTGFGILVQAGVSAAFGGVAFLVVAHLLEIEESERFIKQFKVVLKKFF